MYKILDYIIVIFMFIGNSMAVDLLGWPNMYHMTFWGRSLPLTYILLLYFVIRFNKIIHSNNFHYLFYLIVFFLISIYTFVVGSGGGSGELSSILATLITPMMAMFWALDMEERGNKKQVKALFMLLFVIYLFVAIYEKISHTLLFPYSHYNQYDLNGTTYGAYMRSNSFLGHPLANAFFVSVVIIFVLLSNMKTITKYIFYACGFLSLFCFGGRGAVFISFGFFVLSFFMNRNEKMSYLLIFKSLIILSIFFVFVYILASQSSFGDRINNIDEGSAYARIEAFQYLMNLDSSSLFIGIGNKDFMMEHDNAHIENWFLIFVLKFGILISIFIVFFIFKICFYGLKRYSLSQKICLFGVFILVASTNNSLGGNNLAFPVFFLCCVIFKDIKISNVREGNKPTTVNYSEIQLVKNVQKNHSKVF